MKYLPEQVALDGLQPDQPSLFGNARVGADEQEAPKEEFDHLLLPLEGPLDELFALWSNGSEAAWARAAWAVLGRRGMLAADATDPATQLDNAALLLALAAIHNRFSGIRLGDGAGSSWQWAYPHVDEAELGTTQIDAGRWAAGLGLSDPSDSGETVSGLVKQRVYDVAPDVFDALESEWGPNGLFTGLWITAEPHASFPPSGEDMHRIMNSPDPDKMVCHDWLTGARDL